jgi:hypothetical protein
MTNETIARQIMLDFADRTGLGDARRPPVRYLWTDAFAVCNFMGLFARRLDEEALRLGLQLVDQTHRVLGRHRSDDRRRGWLSGLPEAEGAAHPTRGGLRIGKPRPERGPHEPEDPASEWDRDGQYFHYLTRWMHALERVADVTGDARFHSQACELAKAAYAGFVRRTASGERRLCWKMSIDLSRPQVASTGLHDALDGFITCSTLQAGSRRYARRSDPDPLDLGSECRELGAMCAGQSWDTDDPLGLGGLLCDAQRLARLMAEGDLHEPALLASLLASGLRGLSRQVRQRAFEASPERRLAFRELGLSIGLHAASRIRTDVLQDTDRALLEEILEQRPLARQIESFWLDPRAQACAPWKDHLDINAVMLATSLAPVGYLDLGAPSRPSGPAARV